MFQLLFDLTSLSNLFAQHGHAFIPEGMTRLYKFVDNICVYYVRKMKDVTTAEEAWVIIKNDYKQPRLVAIKKFCFCPAPYNAKNRKCLCLHAIRCNLSRLLVVVLVDP